MTRLRFLEGAVETMHAENKGTLKEFVDSIKHGIELIVESLYSTFLSNVRLSFVYHFRTDDSLEFFDEDSAETTHLDTLRDKYTELVTKDVEEKLTRSKFELDDKRMLMLVIGNSRLESVRLLIGSI
jgi:hypothetical protein